MTTDFKLTSGRNRALVCYCDADNEEALFNAIKTVFDNQQIVIDYASDAFSFYIDDPKNALNIALSWGDTARRLRVGGNFRNVCVGVFFYNQPAPPPEPEPDPDVEPDDEPEPPQPPSITELVCDALRSTFGGVYGASAFVISNKDTSFELEVN